MIKNKKSAYANEKALSLCDFGFGGSESDGGSLKSYGEDSAEDAMRVTRSIMIVKPPGYQSQSGSAPASPAGSTPPVSPFSGKVVLHTFFIVSKMTN